MPVDVPTLACLRQAALFRSLSEQEVREILAQARERSASRRETLFRQGEKSESLHACCKGRVKITQVSEQGAEIILRVVTPGEIFGGFGALIDAPYPATAIALESSVVLSWSRQRIEHLLQLFPRFARNLTTILAHRLRETEDRLREQATARVSQRLARTVLRLARVSGRRVGQGVLVDTRLSREELAQMSGTTLFSASRMLSEWQKRGLLGSLRGRLVIRDSHALVTLADDLLSEPPRPFARTRIGPVARPGGAERGLRQRKATRNKPR